MQDPDAPPAQRSHAPPRRAWFKPTAEPDEMTSRLVQWVDENGSIVRLISSNTPHDMLDAPHEN